MYILLLHNITIAGSTTVLYVPINVVKLFQSSDSIRSQNILVAKHQCFDNRK